MRTRILAALFVSVALVSVQSATAQSKSGTAKNPKSLSRKLNQVKSQKSRVAAELRATTQKARVVTTDLRTLEARLESLGEQVEETRANLHSNRAEQVKLAENLKQMEVLVAETRAKVRSRLRAMYMQTNGSYISIVSGAQTVGDFVSRSGMLRTIAEKDRELFDRYESLTRNVSEKKRQQDSVVRQYEKLRAFEDRKEAELSDVREEKSIALKQLRSRQAELKKLLQQFQADERNIAAEIAAYNRRIKKNPKTARKPFKGRFMRPVNAPVTSGFGNRFHPILRISRLHAGTDFGARSGSPIFAVADGTVISASYSGGYGNRIILDHGGGLTTVYAHCSSLAVRAGQTVRQGQRIGAVGSTGLSTGPHLHFEMRINGRPVNPMSRL
ncbi:COG4942 Membrane-bound metallopeptidase [Fimbriimonadaceae bacterium]